MLRYGDGATMWRVAHEAIKPDGDWLEQSSNLWRGMGSTDGIPDYIPRAFDLASASRSTRDIRLYYDDALNAAIGEGATETTYQLVKELKRRQLPIDGVGFQMHLTVEGGVVTNNWGERFDYDGFTTNLRRYADLGIEVYLTEFDVRVDGNTDAHRQAQAQVYGEVARRFVAEPNAKAMLFWGLDDEHGWENQFFPTMFDPDGTAKPAYFTVLDAVLAAGPR